MSLSPKSELDLSPLRCLIVDDNENMRKLTLTILHALGIKNVREASDGGEAYEQLVNFEADLAILDWVMSPEDGISLTRRIRTRGISQNPYFPIIMLTGHTERKRIEIAQDAGVTEFLSKQFRSWDFRNVLSIL